MTAWVLVVALGMNYSVSVSDISTKQECERLGKEMSSAGLWSPVGFPYQKALDK